MLASLIATCKLNDVEPQAYIQDVITKLVGGPEPPRRAAPLGLRAQTYRRGRMTRP